MNDLQQLRTAAQSREWTTAQDTLKRLLVELDPLIAVSVAAPLLMDFLPTFEGHYPDATWVRELLLTVVNYASAPNELPEQSVNQFPSPGCGNFVKAVLDLARAIQPKYTVFERYSHITNAIASAILAELMHQYYRQHPADFALLTSEDASQDEKTQVTFRFWLDEAVAERDRQLWLGVADTLEQKVQGR
ncbi:MAG: hypothetical protein SF029_16290 [bacterium]|nr:hypothetical protein [bacterium]